ncbi:GNAT family N-acetyltransferase [Flavobacteriaceae bacterium S0862]|nr:GNAT family N-acetyltransferase [Flavobacteriaceae bacterium S0862]
MIGQIDSFEINPIHKDDAWELCNFIVANEDRLKHFFPKTLEQNLNPTLSNLFVGKKVKEFNNSEKFLFTLKQSKTRDIVGLVYIKELDWNKKQGEFAYCIGYQFEGKGITSKAVKELSNYAFETLKLETLQIIAHKTNISSVKVAVKNDYSWIKTLKNAFTSIDKIPLDMELYELTKK